ncbi:MAG: hypothetical protein DLM55_02490 [Acidimicrobiales bacterium]|nr:MAG: hypothetical protein DLM55_02490 [Acidimicrobiales bacterium]
MQKRQNDEGRHRMLSHGGCTRTLRRLWTVTSIRHSFAAATIVVCVMLSTAWTLHSGLLTHYAYDLNIYRGALQYWLFDGGALYDFSTGPFSFVYPPFAAVLLSPLAFNSTGTAFIFVTEVSLCALGAATWFSIFPMAKKYSWNRLYVWALAVTLSLALTPIWITIGLGQINLILLFFVLADFTLLRANSRFAGIGIGLASAIKLTPLLFIVYLAATRRWRAMFTAIGTGMAATLIGFIILPKDSWRYFTHEIFHARNINNMLRSVNNSLTGFIARTLYEPVAPTVLWLALSIPVVIFALWRARKAYLQGADLAGFAIVGLAAALVSPITWIHHLVWVLPTVVVLVNAAMSSRGTRRWLRLSVAAGVFMLFSSSITMRYGDTPSEETLQQWRAVLLVNAYIIAMLLLVIFLPAARDNSETFLEEGNSGKQESNDPAAEVNLPISRAAIANLDFNAADGDSSDTSDLVPALPAGTVTQIPGSVTGKQSLPGKVVVDDTKGDL